MCVCVWCVCVVCVCVCGVCVRETYVHLGLPLLLGQASVECHSGSPVEAMGVHLVHPRPGAQPLHVSLDQTLSPDHHQPAKEHPDTTHIFTNGLTASMCVRLSLSLCVCVCGRN